LLTSWQTAQYSKKKHNQTQLHLKNRLIYKLSYRWRHPCAYHKGTQQRWRYSSRHSNHYEGWVVNIPAALHLEKWKISPNHIQCIGVGRSQAGVGRGEKHAHACTHTSHWPTTVTVNLLDLSIYQISYTSCFFIDTTGIMVFKFLIKQLSSEIRWKMIPLKFSCLGH